MWEVVLAEAKKESWTQEKAPTRRVSDGDADSLVKEDGKLKIKYPEISAELNRTVNASRYFIEFFHFTRGVVQPSLDHPYLVA